MKKWFTGTPVKARELLECSECHAVVPRASFSEHVDWHETVLMASPSVTSLDGDRERGPAMVCGPVLPAPSLRPPDDQEEQRPGGREDRHGSGHGEQPI